MAIVRPQALLFPLLVSMKSGSGERSRGAAQLMASIAASEPRFMPTLTTLTIKLQAESCPLRQMPKSW